MPYPPASSSTQENSLPVFNGTVFRLVLQDAAQRITRLHELLDSFDAVAGGDADTGTNAALTLSATVRACHKLPDDVDLAWITRVAADACLLNATGTIGLFLAKFLDSFAQNCATSHKLRPVDLADTLSASFQQLTECVMGAKPGGLVDTGEHLVARLATLPHIFGLDTVSAVAAMAVQEVLIEKPPALLGTVDSGSAVMALTMASLGNVLSDGCGIPETVEEMLWDMGEDNPDPAEFPRSDWEFEVQYLFQGSTADLTALREQFSESETESVIVGAADPFDWGTWRIKVRTSTPLSVLPVRGRASQVIVTHNQPPELGQNTDFPPEDPGVLMLEHPARRESAAQKNKVIVMTRAPVLVEAMSRAGAIVVLNPGDDPAVLLRAAMAASAATVLLAPCDSAAADLAQLACKKAATMPTLDEEEINFLVAASKNELQAQAIALRSQMPLPAGITSPIAVAELLQERADAVLNTVYTQSITPEQLPALIISTLNNFPKETRLIILVGADEGPSKISVYQQAVPEISFIEKTILYGGQSGPSLMAVSRL